MASARQCGKASRLDGTRGVCSVGTNGEVKFESLTVRSEVGGLVNVSEGVTSL